MNNPGPAPTLESPAWAGWVPRAARRPDGSTTLGRGRSSRSGLGGRRHTAASRCVQESPSRGGIYLDSAETAWSPLTQRCPPKRLRDQESVAMTSGATPQHTRPDFPVVPAELAGWARFELDFTCRYLEVLFDNLFTVLSGLPNWSSKWWKDARRAFARAVDIRQSALWAQADSGGSAPPTVFPPSDLSIDIRDEAAWEIAVYLRTLYTTRPFEERDLGPVSMPDDRYQLYLGASVLPSQQAIAALPTNDWRQIFREVVRSVYLDYLFWALQTAQPTVRTRQLIDTIGSPSGPIGCRTSSRCPGLGGLLEAVMARYLGISPCPLFCCSTPEAGR